MHLLGRSFKLVLNPGTPQAKTVLNVPDYNFHYQKAYNLARPIPVTIGEKLQVTCTYDPTLAQELPILRKAPPHFVTWGEDCGGQVPIGSARSAVHSRWQSPSDTSCDLGNARKRPAARCQLCSSCDVEIVRHFT